MWACSSRETIYLLSVSVFLIGRFFRTGLGLMKVIWGTASGSIFVPLGVLHLCGSEVQESSAGTSVSPISCQFIRAVINPTRWEQVSPLLKIKEIIVTYNMISKVSVSVLVLHPTNSWDHTEKDLRLKTHPKVWRSPRLDWLSSEHESY